MIPAHTSCRYPSTYSLLCVSSVEKKQQVHHETTSVILRAVRLLRCARQLPDEFLAHPRDRPQYGGQPRQRQLARGPRVRLRSTILQRNFPVRIGAVIGYGHGNGEDFLL